MVSLLDNNLTKKPVCSVCIANYNGIGVIHECLNSIMQQDCDFQIEIIVHDDASTDNSVEFICRHFPEIILIKSKKNAGFCVSNNRMAAKACGKYILILNNDAMLHANALKTFYEYAEMINKPAVLGIRQYNAASGVLIDFGIFLDPFMNSIPNRNFKRMNVAVTKKIKPAKASTSIPPSMDVAMVMGACLWLPKTLWDETGGFPEWFHTMHEDMYLCCMARLYGYPVRVIKQSGYNHWVGKSLGGGKVVKNRLSTPLKRRVLSERNRIYVMVLCYPDPLFKLILPLHLLLLFLEGSILAVIKKDLTLLDSIYLSAIRSFWQKRKKLFTLRHQIHKQSHVSCKKFFSMFSPVPHKLRMLIKHGLPEIS